jgi:hypothetical protein
MIVVRTMRVDAGRNGFAQTQPPCVFVSPGVLQGEPATSEGRVYSPDLPSSGLSW